VLKNPAIHLTFKEKKNFASQSACGMKYLHSNNPPIIHRDLKTANLLVDKNWNIKVTDFGLSREMSLTQGPTMTHCGTVEFCAPEVLQKTRYSLKADVYSFGILLWQIFTRRDIYSGMGILDLVNRVAFQRMRPPTDGISPPALLKLIKSCWHDNPEKRPSFAEIVDLLAALPDQPSTTPVSTSKTNKQSSTSAPNNPVGHKATIVKIATKDESDELDEEKQEKNLSYSNHDSEKRQSNNNIEIRAEKETKRKSWG